GNYSLKVPAGLGSKVNTVLKKVAPAGSVPRAETSAGTYVVQPGDTLSGIAKHTGVSISTLRRLNGIEGSVIGAGQRLRLKPD
ncbi:MAG: LysM domain-containing protein, partial [Pseudomonadota bacterium]